MTGADWSTGWLYCRCLLWGLATGAAAGAGTGALLGAGSYLGAGFAVTGAVIGAMVGVVVALCPSFLGACVVTQIVRWRHPLGVSADDLRTDLGVIFTAVAAIINAASLLAIIAASDASRLVLLLVGDLCGGAVLWWARASITKSWADVG